MLVCADCHTACLCQMPFLLSCICDTGHRLTKDALLLRCIIFTPFRWPDASQKGLAAAHIPNQPAVTLSLKAASWLGLRAAGAAGFPQETRWSQKMPTCRLAPQPALQNTPVHCDCEGGKSPGTMPVLPHAYLQPQAYCGPCACLCLVPTFFLAHRALCLPPVCLVPCACPMQAHAAIILSKLSSLPSSLTVLTLNNCSTRR